MPAVINYYDFVGNSTLKAPHSLVFSPITLNQGWPKLWRLLFLTVTSFFAAMMNGYFISSFFIENSLTRIANVYQACLGMADSIITCGILPIVSIVLLSGMWDFPFVCKILQFMTECSTYMYSLFFLLTSIENYFRCCRSRLQYDWFLSVNVSTVSLCVCAVGLTLAAIGVLAGLDYDYCQRLHHGDTAFRLTTFVLFHALPGVFTVYCLTASFLSLRLGGRDHMLYRRCTHLDQDKNAVYLNIVAYITYAAFWTPYLVISFRHPSASNVAFYFSAWVGVARSALTSCLFGFCSVTFRKSYFHLFKYCCCKVELAKSGGPRRRRGADVELGGPTPASPRQPPPSHPSAVHLLHHAVQSPRRAAASAAKNT